VHVDHARMADVATVSARWAKVTESIRAAVRALVSAKDGVSGLSVVTS
jgi:hypothetical protein